MTTTTTLRRLRLRRAMPSTTAAGRLPARGGRRAPQAAGCAACPAAWPRWWRWRSSSAASTSASPRASSCVKDQFAAPADYPGPGTARSPSRSRRATPSPRSAATSKAQGVVKSVDAFTDAAAADPEASGIQVGFYQLQKEMAADGRARDPRRPGQPGQTHGDDPRGPAGRRHRRHAGEEHRLLRRRSSSKALRRPRQRSGCPTTPRATRRATCSRRPTTSAPDDDADDDARRRWSTAGSRPPTTPTSRSAAEDARLHPAGADDDRQPGRGRGPRRRQAQDRPGHLQPAREPDDGDTDGLLQIDATVNYALRPASSAW